MSWLSYLQQPQQPLTSCQHERVLVHPEPLPWHVLSPALRTPTQTPPPATSPPSSQPPPYHLPRSRSRSPMQTSAPADRRRTTPKTTKSRRRTRQSSESNMNSNGSERRRTLEAPELLRSRDPPPGSILAALRRTESSLTHGAATPVHCRGIRPPGSGTSILPIGGGDIPTGPWTAAPEEKTFLVEEI